MYYRQIRVSGDKQTVENQRFETARFTEENGFEIGGWIEETICGTKNCDKRELGKLLNKVAADDVIVCSELSRPGRNFISQRTK